MKADQPSLPIRLSVTPRACAVKSLLTLLFAVLMLSGCAAPTRKQDSLYSRIDKRYGLAALAEFLRGLVKSHPEVEGLMISETTIREPWIIDNKWLPVGLAAGDWTFQERTNSDTDFSFSHRIGEEGIIFSCRRVHRGDFVLLSVTRERVIRLTVDAIEVP